MYFSDSHNQPRSPPIKSRARKTARQIQTQLDSLRSRERISASRNSALLSDISRLKKQVRNMNVSVNRLERARGNYDRYVETCMVNWIQKSFRESGTDSRHSYGSTQEQTPTKNIGVQTTLEHSTAQLSDWSISPDTLIHSTLLVPEVSDRLPPRDTSRPSSRHPATKPPVDVSSVMPSTINFSDLRDPSLPLQDTFSTPRGESILSVPTLQSGMNAGTYSTPLYPHSHTFQSIPNVSMIPQPYLHSYVLPRQPVVYPGIPFSPAVATTHVPLPATYQPLMSPQATSIVSVPISATFVPPVPLIATSVSPTTLSAISESSAPLSATFKPLLESPLAVASPNFDFESTESVPLPEIPVPQMQTATQPLSEPPRQHSTQILRHTDTIPQSVKSPPPPPKSSILSPSKPTPQIFEPSATHLSHSRQSSILPTIPEPSVPLYDHFSTSQPPPATLHTSAGMRRVESAHEFAIEYPINHLSQESVDLGAHHPPEFDTITPSQNLSGSIHTSETHKSDYELDSDSSGSGRDRNSGLKSTPNQFDLTALLVQESGSDLEVSGLEKTLRKPSQVMTESPTLQPPRDHILVLNNLSDTLNKLCQSGAAIYGDTFDHQQAESNVVSNKILSQAATSEMAQLASWDIRTLRNVFLAEISKMALTNGAILSPDILSQPNLDLNYFNRTLRLGCVPLWECLIRHFSALFNAKTSLQNICATFAPLLVAPASSNETVNLGIQVLMGVLNEKFCLEEKGVGSKLDLEPELYQEEAYRSLLRSMTIKSADEGVKSGSFDDLVSAASSISTEGSVAVPFYAGIESKVSELSPTQLLDQAVGEKIPSDSSDSEPLPETGLYVPSFAPQKMTHREKKTKFEKFWGSDLDSEDSESLKLEPSKVVKGKNHGLDDFDFF